MSGPHGWLTNKFKLAGMPIKEGDVIEVGLGRQRIVAAFKGFDRILYAFYIVELDTGLEMIIPYKSVKYLKKIRGGEEG